jgi:uncharacterized protein (DUF1778 family)
MENIMQAFLESVEKTRNSRLEARVSSDQKNYFQYAANLAGRTLSEFVINSTQDAAAKVIAANEVMELSRKEQMAFVSSLLKPAEPGSRLREAAKRYRQAAGL